jgi:hypothetical protein
VELERPARTGFGDPILRYPEIPCWTIVIAGPKVREWGFQCKKMWVSWRYFDYMNGCGEYA